MTTDFEVYVRLADHEWTFTKHPLGPVADGLTVLSGLSFGWSQPGPLWPLQPAVMAASLRLNVPVFADADLDEFGANGSELVIEVKADNIIGDVIARFYGDISDLKATSRDGRPGVFVSVIAVDYTVRVREGLRNVVLVDDETDTTVFELINRLWDDAASGLSDGDAGPSVEWLFPPDPGGVLEPAGIPYGVPADVRKLIDQLLLQSCGDDNRAILSPMVSATTGKLLCEANGEASLTGQIFTLDWLTADPADLAMVWHIPAAAVRRDAFDWSNVKGSIPRWVVATGWGGDSANYTISDSTPDDISPKYTTAETIAVTWMHEGDSQNTTDFYSGRVGFEPWQLDRISIPVTRAGIAVPAGLFPDWTLTEDDPLRAVCYTTGLRITGVDTTRTPDGSDTVEGILTGVTCTIAAGELTLDATVRRRNVGGPVYPPPPPPTPLMIGAWGATPYAGEALVP